MSFNIYNTNLISREIYLDNQCITTNLNLEVEKKIKKEVEGYCISEGYVKPNSVIIINTSSGVLKSNLIHFNIVFECLIAYPIETQKIKCKVNSITKVGFRCETLEDINPFIIFVARDHHHNNSLFISIKENDIIIVKVLGQRFELNDTKISIIAELLEKTDEA